jgi:hypothetical protein
LASWIQNASGALFGLLKGFERIAQRSDCEVFRLASEVEVIASEMNISPVPEPEHQLFRGA